MRFRVDALLLLSCQLETVMIFNEVIQVSPNCICKVLWWWWWTKFTRWIL